MLVGKADCSHWSAYWQGTTSLNSFEGGSQAGQYGGPVQSFWQEQFSRCESGAVLLDIGTGNGALAFMAAKYFQNVGTEISVVAVDAADIAPHNAMAQDRELAALSRSVKFLPKTKVEALPLHSGTIDLAMSQFGFEYAQHKAAIHEIFRVLRPGGRCVFVAHDRRSAIIRDSLTGLDVLTYSLEVSGLFPAAKALLSTMVTKVAQQEVTAADRAFRSIAMDLMSKFSSPETRAWFSPLLKSLVDIVSHAACGNSHLAISLFDNNYMAQISAVRRLREQVGVAFDQEKLDSLSQFCSRHAIRIDTQLLSFGEQVFGTALFMRRNA